MLEELRRRWWRRVSASGLKNEEINVRMRALSPQEAIGRPSRSDFPLLKGREVMIEAEVGGMRGQAFTDEPSDYVGRLSELLRLPLNTNGVRALVVAGINATYRLLGIVDKTRHCRHDEPELCALRMARILRSELGGDVRLGMIGLQPAIAEKLSHTFKMFRVSDMNPQNLGKAVGKTVVESHSSNHEIIKWSDALLVTGTTLVNGTIDEIMDAVGRRLIYFYGVTIAAASVEFGLRRLCFNSR